MIGWNIMERRIPVLTSNSTKDNNVNIYKHSFPQPIKRISQTMKIEDI